MPPGVALLAASGSRGCGCERTHAADLGKHGEPLPVRESADAVGGTRITASRAPESRADDADGGLDDVDLVRFWDRSNLRQPNVPEWLVAGLIPLGEGPWRETGDPEADRRFTPPDSTSWPCDLPVLLGDLEVEDDTPPLIRAEPDAPPCAGHDAGALRVNNCSADMEALYRAAWCMLVENWDVVEWLVNIHFGTTTCISNVLQFRSWGFYVACNDADSGWPYHCDENSYIAHSYEWPISDGHEGYGGIAGEGWITICMEKGTNQARVRAFHSGNLSDAVCAAIDMAATILHELTHICLLNDDTPNNGCEASYTVENSFRWAMLQRFPHACESACCSGWCANLDSLFMSDDRETVHGGCA